MNKYTPDIELEAEYIQKKQEYTEAKEKYDERKRQRKREELAREIFNKGFKIPIISDNYDIFPFEIYQNIRDQFVEEFYDDSDKEYTKSKINDAMEKYIENLETELERFKEEVEGVKEEYQRLNKNKTK